MQWFIFISLLLSIIQYVSCELWNYHDLGPDVWSDTYPSCAKQSQSPINIRTGCTTYQSFTPFQFASAYNFTHNFTLENTGHTVIGTYAGNGSTPLLLTGGGLNGTYHFVNFHLHWGENYKSGSEHQVNGKKYAGEIHFVHLNPETQSIAVLGIFMESVRNMTMNETITTISQTSNSTIEEWIRYFDAGEHLQAVNSTLLFDLNLALLFGNHLNDFWRYEGSFTTPPCTEGIIWTMFKVAIAFTDSEFDSFRNNIYFEDYRGPQPLYDRIVYRSFPEEISSSIPDYSCCGRNATIYMKNLSYKNVMPLSMLIIVLQSIDFLLFI